MVEFGSLDNHGHGPIRFRLDRGADFCAAVKQNGRPPRPPAAGAARRRSGSRGHQLEVAASILAITRLICPAALPEGVAAIDDQSGPCHEARRIARQVDGKRPEILWLAKTCHGRAVLNAVDDLGSLPCPAQLGSVMKTPGQIALTVTP
jgi:hypothetical protein